MGAAKRARINQLADDDEAFRCLEVPQADNPVPAFNEAMVYWEARRGGAFAPAWADIDLMDLPSEVIPNCIVVDIDQTSGVISYRFFGTGIARLHQFELTNRTIDDVEPPAFREHIIGQYDSIIENRRPMLFATEVPIDTSINRFHFMLRLPLSDDGEVVTNILTIEDFGDHRDELHDYYSAQAAGSSGYLVDSEK